MSVAATIEAIDEPCQVYGISEDLAFMKRFRQAHPRVRDALCKTYIYHGAERVYRSKAYERLASEVEAGLNYSTVRDWLKDADTELYFALIESLRQGVLGTSRLAHLYEQPVRFMVDDYLRVRESHQNSHAMSALVKLYCESRGLAYHLGAEAILEHETSLRGPEKENTDRFEGCEDDWEGLNTICPDSVAKTLRIKGYETLGIKLKRSVAQSIKNWASKQKCRITRDGLSPNQTLLDYPPSGSEPTSHIRGNRYCVDPSVLQKNPEFMKIAANPAFGKLASAYLGVPVKLLDVACSWLFPFENTRSIEAAQHYHWDIQTGLRWLKVFILLDDCDFDQGPHSAILGSHNPLAKPDAFYQKGYARISDEEVFSQYSKSDEQVFVGDAGTVFVGDTLAFHKGGQVKQGHRFHMQLIFGTSAYPSYIPQSLLK